MWDIATPWYSLSSDWSAHWTVQKQIAESLSPPPIRLLPWTLSSMPQPAVPPSIFLESSIRNNSKLLSFFITFQRLHPLLWRLPSSLPRCSDIWTEKISQSSRHWLNSNFLAGFWSVCLKIEPSPSKRTWKTENDWVSQPCSRHHGD